jgi:hypothetical protein
LAKLLQTRRGQRLLDRDSQRSDRHLQVNAIEMNWRWSDCIIVSQATGISTVAPQMLSINISKPRRVAGQPCQIPCRSAGRNVRSLREQRPSWLIGVGANHNDRIRVSSGRRLEPGADPAEQIQYFLKFCRGTYTRFHCENIRFSGSESLLCESLWIVVD